MKNLKRVLIVLSLICVVGLGTTYALMSSTTNTATNVFKSGKNVEIALREPGWDGYTFTDTDLPTNPGTSVKPGQPGEDIDMTLGFNQAQNYQPADVITKDPTIKNTSKDTKAYVAFKLEFEGASSLGDFKSKYGELVGLDETKYTIENGVGYTLLIYNTALESGNEVKLFEEVKLKSEIGLVEEKLPTFTIKTTGYATQANITLAEAKAELVNLAK